MRIGLAISAFFRVLFDRQAADHVRRLLRGQVSAEATQEATTSESARQAPAPAPPPARSDAINLLATLQREARFVDLVQESLDQYSDAQVGAAARNVLRDCGGVLERLFGLQPVIADAEGAQVQTPAEVDPGRYRVLGTPSGSPPYTGSLAHHGWEACHCKLPSWQGHPAAAMVIAPAEVEVQMTQ